MGSAYIFDFLHFFSFALSGMKWRQIPVVFVLLWLHLSQQPSVHALRDTGLLFCGFYAAMAGLATVM